MSRLDQLRLRDLLILELIAEHGTLHATAEQLHVSQPAVSQVVKGLEAAMGTSLLERGQRGVTLTPAGEAALAHLRVARQALRAAQRAALQPDTTTLRLGALPFTQLSLVPQALVRLRQAVPGVQVHLLEGSVDGLWRRLREARLDALVGRLPMLQEPAGLLAGIWHRPIGSERLVLAAPQAHAVAGQRRVDFRVLAQQEWVLPPAGSFTRTAFDKRFVREGLAPPVPVVTCGAFHGSLQIAAANGLLTVVPGTALVRYAATLRLRELPIAWREHDSDVVFACHEASLSLPAMQALRDSFLKGAA